MTASDLLMIGGVLALVAFIVFAFRQGMNVKPSGGTDRSTIAGEGQNDGGGGHTGHSGGGY